jgi:hypothetical protein
MDGERQRTRETERQRDRGTEGHGNRETGRQKDSVSLRDSETEGQKDRVIETGRQTCTAWQVGRQIHRHCQWQTDRSLP